MQAVILSGSYVVGWLPNPDMDEMEALGTEYELVESIPDVILNTPPGFYVVRTGEGEYELGEIPEEPTPGPTPEQEIEQLKSDNLSLMLAIAELGAAAEQDKIEVQLALAELAAIITGGAE